MTWVFNVQCKFYEPTPSAHPWIGSQPGFVGFLCFLPHGGVASTKTSRPTPQFLTFPAFSDPFSISLASFEKITWVLNVQCKFYEPTPSAPPLIEYVPWAGFVGFRCFLPREGAISTRLSVRTPTLNLFPHFGYLFLQFSQVWRKLRGFWQNYGDLTLPLDILLPIMA